MEVPLSVYKNILKWEIYKLFLNCFKLDFKNYETFCTDKSSKE